MSRVFKFKQYSFSTKVILSFLIFIFFFILIRFSLVIPKVEEEAYTNEIEHITKNVLFIKEQIRMAVKSINMQRELENKLSKKTIESNILQIKLNNQHLTKFELFKVLGNSELAKFCRYKIEEDINTAKKDDLFSKNDINILNTWIDGKKIESDRPSKYTFYNIEFSPTILLSFACDNRNFNPGHKDFEESLRLHIAKNLSLSKSTHNSKTLVTGINKKYINDDSPLYEENQEFKKKKYRISKLSNTRKLTTGNLSVKEVLAAKDKEPIEHILDNEKVITWVAEISIAVKNDIYVLIYTIKKEDLLHKSRANLFVLLPETLIAISIAFVLILLIFKRLFRNITTLSETAIQVNQGKKHIRSNVKGEDDIGILGQAFDSMLDNFEDSIKTLDLKVKDKTKEITKSLEEKDTLLKEIHHRVKNNLSLTISLIELQEEEVNDEKTKKVLTDIQERIYTMELLHRKLYESRNLNEISLKEYIKDLVEAISYSYDLEKKVELSIDIEDIELNIERVMPYGLIINELVTNAYKYAFINHNKPKLELQIYKKDKSITIIIKDNGKGLKKDFSLNNSTSLGLKLINTIVKYQLFGTVDYIYEEGTKFIIKSDISE